MVDEIPKVRANESDGRRHSVQTTGKQASETERCVAIGACIEALAEELEALAARDQSLARFRLKLR